MSELPARLIFLSDLASAEPNDKVRFLCCIDRYRSLPGSFYAKHDFPPTTTPPTVIVDLEHVLETAMPVDLQVGTWVNVVGYVTKVRSQRNESRTSNDSAPTAKVYIQAIMLWSAGGVKLKEYEEALQSRKDSTPT